MAAPTPIDIDSQLLRTLHRIHQQKADLSGQQRRGPLQIKAVNATVEQAKAECDSIAANLKSTRVLADEKQLQLKSREDHVQSLKAKLNTAGTNKEFQLLKDQIAADEQANGVQGDEIFEVLERIDAIEIELSEAETVLAAKQSEAAERITGIETRLAEVDQELARVEDQLKAAEATIPAAAKSDYDRIVASRGEEAFAPIEANSCGSCFQTLTTQLIDRVMLSKLVRCPSCNAFLYLAEDNRVR
ncbi:MAG: C4-type zinc ribbon domain-containing protein [Planctomycetota bacterium]